MRNIWKDGMYGLIAGDALGVPVEFTSRDDRKRNPVVEMISNGTHNQPAGTWSDDSSMAIATLDSIVSKGGIDYDDIMTNFTEWCFNGKYTPFGDAFDIGIGTSRAIINYNKGAKPLDSGGKTEWDNGNGSLMRILPVCLYAVECKKSKKISDEDSINIIHDVSSLTHAHIRSKISCGIYYYLVKAIVECEGELISRLQYGMDNAVNYYENEQGWKNELINFNRIFKLSVFKETLEEDIKSSGYVVDTLEAAIWCLINTSTYSEAVLKAVNLGDDTDTVGAVTGGLAGLFYGYENIPDLWKGSLQRGERIEEMLEAAAGTEY